MKRGVTPVIYYCNPNIYPREEYEIRKNECTRYAQALGLEIVDADYDHEEWLAAVRGLESEPERGGRCLKCFRLRLLRTAMYARERGIRVITTTLASSRWKSLEQIREAGEWACGVVGGDCHASLAMTEPALAMTDPKNAMTGVENEMAGVENAMAGAESAEGTEKKTAPVFWGCNWRKGGLQERRLQIIREYGFYNQLYCGCEFSMRKEDAQSAGESVL